MKKLVTVLSVLSAILLFTAEQANAQLFQQDFNSALAAGNQAGGATISNTGVTSDAVYVNSAASNSQFTFLSTNNDAASISINGDGVMRFSRNGAGTVYMVRNVNFTGSPTAVKVSFDFNTEVNTANSSNAIQFIIGSNFLNSNNEPAATDKHSRFYVNTKSPTGTPGTWGVTAESGPSPSAYNVTKTIVWVVNNSGQSLDYAAPDGSTESIADDKFDVWIGTTKEINDAAALTAGVNLNNFEIRAAGGTGTYTIDNLSITTVTQLPVPVKTNGTGGGKWDSTATWQGGVVPGNTDDVDILAGDSVFVTAADTCKSVTIESGGKLNMLLAGTMAANSLIMKANSILYNNTANPTPFGALAAYQLDNTSTIVHTGSGTVGAGNNLTFGNLVIQRNAGITAGGNLVINGNLTINNNAVGTTFRGTNQTLGSQTHTVHGNIIINTGTFSAIDVGASSITCIWNVDGDVLVNGANTRFGPFSSAGADGLGIFNISGDLIITGGRLQAGSSSTTGPGTGIINLGGDLVFSSGAVATNSIGPFAINFTGTGTQNVTLGVHLSMGTGIYDTVKAGSNVVFNYADTLRWGSTTAGEFVVNGTLDLAGGSRLTGVGSFKLNPGGTLKIGSPDGITSADALGNIQVTGTRTYNQSANYEYKGTALQASGNGLPSTVNKLTVNNAAGVTLTSDVTVNDTLKLTNGDLSLNGKTVTLGTNGMLVETAGNTVKGTSGKITITKNIGTPAGVNVGGLGAVITANKDLGSTTVERYHAAPTGAGNQGILRYYNISPAQNNSGLSATLRFNYDDSELNGNSESLLVLFKSATGITNTWAGRGGVVNTTANYIELTSLTDFSYWAAASSGAPIPVELTSFAASVADKNVVLNWSTATETQNQGWNIERKSITSSVWEKIGFVEGAGTRTESASYKFTDANVLSGKVQYRLKQMDYSGTFKFSQVTEVEINNLPVEFALHQNYPNPFNPSTTIKFDIPEASFVNVSIYNALGEKVATLVNEQMEPGVYTRNFDAANLGSGIYFYKFAASNKVFTKKMIMIK